MFFKQFRDDLAVVFQRDPAARNFIEILMTYPGVHAVLLHRLALQKSSLKVAPP